MVRQIEARRQIVKKAGCCFMCLRTEHISKECRSKTRCSKCGKCHHNTICLNETAGMNEGATSVQQGAHNSNQKPNTSEANCSKLNVNASSFPPQQRSMSLYLSTNKTVLLQTISPNRTNFSWTVLKFVLCPAILI